MYMMRKLRNSIMIMMSEHYMFTPRIIFIEGIIGFPS